MHIKVKINISNIKTPIGTKAVQAQRRQGYQREEAIFSPQEKVGQQAKL